MAEYVRRPLTACQEAITLDTVEPLDACPDPIAGRLNLHARALREKDGIDRCALVHRQDVEGLHPARALEHLAVDTGPLVGRLVSTCTQARHMQQDVRSAIVRHDEPKAFRNVEPLDGAGDLQNLCTLPQPAALSFGRCADARWRRRKRVIPHLATPLYLK